MGICLCMIVKNESAVIERCLNSVKASISSWVIVDTGSTDDTKEIITKTMAGVEGTLLQSPWVNFEHNRNEAITKAKDLYPEAQYLYFIDADEELIGNLTEVTLQKIEVNFSLIYKYGSIEYPRLSLVRTDQPWRYQGVLHEYLHLDGPFKTETLGGCHVIVRPEGARSKDPEKYTKDAALLLKALETEPNNSRYVFYLAQSYRDAGNLTEAIKAYTKRSRMGGWGEEIWYSWYQVGVLRESLGDPFGATKAYLAAFELDPHRAEVPGRLARLLRGRKNYQTARLFAQAGLSCAQQASLFVEPDYYDWICRDELAISLYWCGLYEGAEEQNLYLLSSGLLPPGQVERVRTNLRFCAEKLGDRKKYSTTEALFAALDQ